MPQKLLLILTVIIMTNCQNVEAEKPIDFTINVKENVTAEAGLCIIVYCLFTVPQSVSDPIRTTWFKGDPQNPTVKALNFNRDAGVFSPDKECSFTLNTLVPGESDGEYRLKLEWGQGQEHIFPQTVNVIVKELKQKPIIKVPLLTEGQKAKISCKFEVKCNGVHPDIVWTGIEPEEVKPSFTGMPGYEEHFSTMIFHPKPEHHNTNVTCRATFEKSLWTEATVTLEVRQPDEPIDFSIRVAESVTGEAGLCIRVFCLFTVPKSVSDPIRTTWFKGNPQNPTVEASNFRSNVGGLSIEKECSFMLNSLIPGKSNGKYRLKLEWGQGQVFIFPQTVDVMVKELKQKPIIDVPPLTEGQKAKISCKFEVDCNGVRPDIVWSGIEPKNVISSARGVPGREEHFSTMIIHPEPEHHNTNVTCRFTFKKRFSTEATVTLEVRRAPKILNHSRCLVWGDELTCMCVSSGVPFPHISWPILDGAVEYYNAFSSENTISIISIPNFRNINETIECVSKNLIGMTKKEIQVLNHPKTPKGGEKKS